jgi:hypothetical protein
VYLVLAVIVKTHKYGLICPFAIVVVLKIFNAQPIPIMIIIFALVNVFLVYVHPIWYGTIKIVNVLKNAILFWVAGVHFLFGMIKPVDANQKISIMLYNIVTWIRTVALELLIRKHADAAIDKYMKHIIYWNTQFLNK